MKVNKQLIEQKNIETLKDCTAPLMQKIESNEYANDPQRINRDVNEAVIEYNRKARGENKGEILS